MKKLYQACAILAVAVASPSFASDEDVLPSSKDELAVYRNADGWTVHENLTRKSCLISRSGENGGLVQMGLTKDGNYGYIGVFAQGAQVEDGAKDIGILINGNLYFGQSESVAENLADGYAGGYVLTNNKNLVDDIESADEMVAFPETPYVYTINLAGAKNAIYEARKCTEALQGG